MNDNTTKPPSRVTIDDIARALELSSGAVSFALNGRPGVSEATRTRVLDKAAELGWKPRLRRRRDGELAQVIGFVLKRRSPNLAVESFYSQFVAGVESELSKHRYGLLWQIVGTMDDEMDVYRRWQRVGTVDGVVLVDVQPDDPRISYFSRPGALPAIVVGDRSVAGELTSISVDDGGAMRDLVNRLAAFGHQNVLRISGEAGSAYTAFRDAAFLESAGALGLTASIDRSDLSARSGAILTRRALTMQRRPTAIIYENDLMTLAGQGVAAELGLRVPADLSTVTWDDSPLCAIANPPLSAMSRDVLSLGAHTASHLLDVVMGGEPSAFTDATPGFRPRGTTAPAPALRGGLRR